VSEKTDFVAKQNQFCSISQIKRKAIGCIEQQTAKSEGRWGEAPSLCEVARGKNN